MIFAAIVPGSLLALAALLLRRLEDLSPDPAAVAPRQGLGHMLTGVLGWASILVFVVASVTAGGALHMAVLIVAVLVMLRIRSLGPGVRRFYRLRLPLAAAALAFAIGTLVSLLETLQGVFNV